MKREIKFRGIRKEYNKDWHKSEFKYGSLLNHQSIGEVGSDLDSYEYADVIPETVGQFTGLKDKNGVEVYEGDVVKVNKDEIGSVTFDSGSFWVSFYQEPAKQHLSDFVKYNLKTDKYDIYEIEIIGKIAQLKVNA